MKPTVLQTKVIELCEGQLAFWKGTNDISSPTHFCDIDSDFDNFSINNNISEEKLWSVKKSLEKLLKDIRDL